jgi:translin
MSWGESVKEAQQRLEAMHEGREAALRHCRLLIQISSRSIRCSHRREFEEAKRLLDEAVAISQSTREAVASFPELLHAGYVNDAEKELVEAAMVLAALQGDELPGPGALKVSLVAYLNGAGEAASELRRTVLDLMRSGNLPEARRLVGIMEMVHDDLGTLDFPDGLTGGLRRTNDALRAVIERTRSDLVLTEVQSRLHEELVLARKERG